MIRIEFSFDSPYGVFRDAVFLPDDHGLTDAEIETMKQDRFSNWLAIVTPQEPVDGE
jgi:hypothetical protein